MIGKLIRKVGSLMNLEVLVSTMFDDISLYKKMNIQGSAVIINQADYNDKKIVELGNNEKLKFISMQERGLSKSRNQAIRNSNADICLFTDNDVVFESDYRTKILNAYKKHPDADIIAFRVDSTSSERSLRTLRPGRVGRVMSMKLSSVQISFKRNIIEREGLYLNEDFGAGTSKFISGEENIFLYQAIKKGLKLYYVDEKIAEVSFEGSTWHGGDPVNVLVTKGAMFYQMSPILYPFYNLQFALRRSKEYNEYTLLEIIKIMFRGSREGRNIDT